MEQFSICSSDSIWEDEERRNEYFESKFGHHRDIENYMHTIHYNDLQRIQQYSIESGQQCAEQLMPISQADMELEVPIYTNFKQVWVTILVFSRIENSFRCNFLRSALYRSALFTNICRQMFQSSIPKNNPLERFFLILGELNG